MFDCIFWDVHFEAAIKEIRSLSGIARLEVHAIGGDGPDRVDLKALPGHWIVF
jgi:hypothetical protein